MYESEERPLILAAVTDEQRSVWIAALHLANCESLRLQIRDLQEKIWAKTGRDPLVEPPESAPESGKPGSAYTPDCSSFKDLSLLV